MNEWFRNQDIIIEKEILIALQCILTLMQETPYNKELLEAREKYLKSTIKRITEVIETIK